MRPTDYWGVGPATRDRLVDALGEAGAVDAIESADIEAMVEAGVSAGRATRILRRAGGAEGLAALATGDARRVYRELLDRARTFALTRRAADRIRVLTPLADREAMEARLDRIEAARETWRGLSGAERETLGETLESEAGADADLAAVDAARDLRAAGLTSGVLAPLADLDGEALTAAARALRGLEADGGVAAGVDDELDAARTALGAARDLAADPAGVVEDVRAGDLRGGDAFRTALVAHVAEETGVDRGTVRETTPRDATDAAAFAGETLRGLVETLEGRVDDRTATVRERLEADRDRTAGLVERASETVERVTLDLSLARFAETHDMCRPTFTDDATLAVEGATNIELAAADADVQPVDYGLGAHGLDLPEERVSVLTGANSGGKTTLLETLAAVVLLARMGLPVPAERARLAPDLRVVFHRRHASFNAGVLESTLRSIVPPVTEPGRTLMLVDEFEAITEPGSAAELLHGLVRLTVGADGPGEADSLGTFVTHLAADLEPLPETARVDGIFARGLDADLELEVDYQPRFHELGRSTPEFIVSRLLADAEDRRARAGFEALATAVGQEAVQRTLDDAAFQS